MQRLFKKLLITALLILCAPLGFHHAQGERDRMTDVRADAPETSLSRTLDFMAQTSSENFEVSATRDETGVARQLRLIPFASYVLFLKEYSEIEE
jgi:hypothetical protein